MGKMEENICLKEASDWPNGRSNTHKKKNRERERERERDAVTVVPLDDRLKLAQYWSRLGSQWMAKQTRPIRRQCHSAVSTASEYQLRANAVQELLAERTVCKASKSFNRLG